MTDTDAWVKKTATGSWTHNEPKARHEASQACAKTLPKRTKSWVLMHKKVMLRTHTRRAELGIAQKRYGLMKQSNI